MFCAMEVDNVPTTRPARHAPKGAGIRIHAKAWPSVIMERAQRRPPRSAPDEPKPGCVEVSNRLWQTLSVEARALHAWASGDSRPRRASSLEASVLIANQQR